MRPYEPLAGLTLCEPSYKDMAYSLGLVLDLVFSSRSFCCCVAVLLLRDPGSGNRGRTLDSMIFGFAQVYGTSCLHCICIWARLQGCFSASCFSTCACGVRLRGGCFSASCFCTRLPSEQTSPPPEKTQTFKPIHFPFKGCVPLSDILV